MTQTNRARFAPVAIVAGIVLLAGGSYTIAAPKAEKRAVTQEGADKSKAAKKDPGKLNKDLSRKPQAKKPPPRKQALPKNPPTPEARRAAPSVRAAVPVPLPRARPDVRAAAPSAFPASRFLAAATPMLIAPALGATRTFAPAETAATLPSNALSYAPAAAPLDSEIDAVRDAINLVRRGKTEAASERREQIRNTAAQKLVEWMILRAPDTNASFARYAAFVRANPSWPSTGMIRRRAEAQLWHEKREPGTVFAFFSKQEPASGRGKLAMARALLAQGDRAGAQRYAREAWREDDFSADFEGDVMETFGALLTAADHRARMHVRLYADDLDTAMRAAKRLGAAEVAIVQARGAVNRKANNAGALLEAVPAAARSDAAYMLTRIQHHRRKDDIGDAARLMLAAPREPQAIHDAREWWIERRILARKLLDADNPQAAYRIAAGAVRPPKEYHAVDQEFTAGWIALRFLNDPNTAMRHFAQVTKIAEHPSSLARGHYWQGRAAEALGRQGEARQHYEAASAQSAAYYGQLARARLGRRDIALRHPPRLSSEQRAALRSVDLVRAVELLYATDNRELVLTFVADLERVQDTGVLTLIAETAAKHNDARAMLYLGKDAIARGFTFDQFAFPGIGLPKYASIGPEAERSLVYAIARQESAFNPRAVSSAKAMGLMQVTPGTGRVLARKHGVKFDVKRLLNDSVYNMQMGAAELGSLVRDYDGCYVLAFVGYNAGRGRVREWIARYGDPRDPKVDVVDWVERIPFTETRNYVQRVMENMQVYRARFSDDAGLRIEADMRGARR